MKKDPTILRSIELYCGVMSPIGVHNTGVNCALAVDHSDSVEKAFTTNFKGKRFIPFLNADIENLTSTDILSNAKVQKGQFFLMVITAPCPGFSISGKKDPFDPRNALFLHGQKMIKETAPEIFICENVPGMALPYMTPIWNEIKHRFVELSDTYEIQCMEMNALFFGSCQVRNRLIFIGIRKDLGFAPVFPEPDVNGALSRRIKDLFPQIDGIYTGQSEKCVKLPEAYLMTATAGESFKIMQDGYLRKATLDELKIIAGLPEWFSFDGLSETEIHRIVGNGVPVPFMESLVVALKNKYLERFNENC
jgi:site-specific DNA-cytosine methylase